MTGAWLDCIVCLHLMQENAVCSLMFHLSSILQTFRGHFLIGRWVGPTQALSLPKAVESGGANAGQWVQQWAALCAWLCLCCLLKSAPFHPPPPPPSSLESHDGTVPRAFFNAAECAFSANWVKCCPQECGEFKQHHGPKVPPGSPGSPTAPQGRDEERLKDQQV